MQRWRIALLVAVAAGCARELREESPGRGADPRPVPVPSLPYPETRREEVVEELHGVRVADPYRWLEEFDAPETRAWIEAQNALTESTLAAIPARERIRDRLRRVLSHERLGIPRKEGGRYFFARNSGLQDQDVLYVADALEGEPRVLVDPNAFSEDGTVALSGWAPSRDGRLLAYGLAEAGSDWQVWRVRDVERGEDLPDLVEWVKFSAASWTADGEGFFYSRYDAPAEGQALSATNVFQKVYYHRIGTRQEEDALVYARPDRKEWGFAAEVTDDGRYLIIAVRRGTDSKNGIFYRDLQGGRSSSSSPTSTRRTTSSETRGRSSGSGPTSMRRAAARSRSTSDPPDAMPGGPSSPSSTTSSSRSPSSAAASSATTSRMRGARSGSTTPTGS